MAIEIIPVDKDRKQYLDLLLLADEQESMIDRYLSRGDMFILYEDGVKAECVITKEGNGVYEIKNIATEPAYQRRGYAKRLIEFLFQHYTDVKTILVGTGDSALTIPFYQSCGFRESHRVRNFFTGHYDHPIVEDGKLLTDMVYLKWER